jgi:hypothetical protein
VCASLALAVALWQPLPARVPETRLPDRIGDGEFWRLVTQLSEPGGNFRSDNLVSNEVVFAHVVPELVRAAKAHGVYLGVGPEQNFTYIAAIRPRIAFIVDIRRGNLHLHLLYKALFELSGSRAEFVARLFNRDGVDRLGPDASARDLFAAAIAAPVANEATYRSRLADVRAWLTTMHRLPLTEEDLDAIEFIYAALRRYGPTITWNSSANGTTGGRAEYAELMTQTDAAGQPLSYLATEAVFQEVKELQTRNLVVPIVGDFAGGKALKAIGQYLREHGSVLTAFYVSNVESYLRLEDKWLSFCGNVTALPFDDTSVFVRPMGLGMLPDAAASPAARALQTPLGRVAVETAGCTVGDAPGVRMQ